MASTHTHSKHRIEHKRIRAAILQAVRDMAKAHPGEQWAHARDNSGLFIRIKKLAGRWSQPTAAMTWSSVGLTRSHLLNEFYLTQKEIVNRPSGLVQVLPD